MAQPLGTRVIAATFVWSCSETWPGKYQEKTYSYEKWLKMITVLIHSLWTHSGRTGLLFFINNKVHQAQGPKSRTYVSTRWFMMLSCTNAASENESQVGGELSYRADTASLEIASQPACCFVLLRRLLAMYSIVMCWYSVCWWYGNTINCWCTVYSAEASGSRPMLLKAMLLKAKWMRNPNQARD